MRVRAIKFYAFAVFAALCLYARLFATDLLRMSNGLEPRNCIRFTFRLLLCPILMRTRIVFS